MVAAYDQQTACLVVLPPPSAAEHDDLHNDDSSGSGATVLLPFGHKDAGEGQRFLISYDGAASFSNTIFELHVGSSYASSIHGNFGSGGAGGGSGGGNVLTAFSCQVEDTQSACNTSASSELQFAVWSPPEQSDPAHTGFFVPAMVPFIG